MIHFMVLGVSENMDVFLEMVDKNQRYLEKYLAAAVHE